MQKLFLLASLVLLVFSNANSAPYPFAVESQLLGSDINILSSEGSVVGASDANWMTPSTGDFEFSIAGVTGTGAIDEVYSAGAHTTSTIADSVFPSQNVTWEVNNNQLGMHSILDWNFNQWDLFVVWDLNTNGSVINYSATDMDSNGVRGFQFVNGPFAGLDMTLDVVITTPVPAAFWLFISGMLGLLGSRGFKS